MRFADTSFWYAILDVNDDRHGAAIRLSRQNPGRLVTTNHVVGETWTLARRRLGHGVAVAFLDGLDPLAELVGVDAEIEADAWNWLRRHDERTYSFVDATSFAVMRRRRVREALAFDGHFTAAGFIELRPSSP